MNKREVAEILFRILFLEIWLKELKFVFMWMQN